MHYICHGADLQKYRIVDPVWCRSFGTWARLGPFVKSDWRILIVNPTNRKSGLSLSLSSILSKHPQGQLFLQFAHPARPAKAWYGDVAHQRSASEGAKPPPRRTSTRNCSPSSSCRLLQLHGSNQTPADFISSPFILNLCQLHLITREKQRSNAKSPGHLPRERELTQSRFHFKRPVRAQLTCVVECAWIGEVRSQTSSHAKTGSTTVSYPKRETRSAHSDWTRTRTFKKTRCGANFLPSPKSRCASWLPVGPKS